MEQDLISIVVPVYRAENYIEETLDCVRAQTYTNWELLLIEDCGPDHSSKDPTGIDPGRIIVSGDEIQRNAGIS
jgi:glycosyltransferase involved in cell wall biosynthesis